MPLSEKEKSCIERTIRLRFLAQPDVSATRTFIAMMRNDDWLKLVDDKKNIQDAKTYAGSVLTELNKGGTKELCNLGIEAIAVSSEKHAPPGYRALDGVARLIAKTWPKEICVAACVEPRYQRSILISSNGRGLDTSAVQQLLENVAKATLSFGDQDQNHLIKLSSARGSLSSEDRTAYLNLREKRDVAKLRTAANNMPPLASGAGHRGQEP
jgi:hypothetical protein